MKKTLRERIRYYFKYKFLSEHISIGRFTIYGRNAMHWGVHFYTKKYGYICFRLPLPCYGRWWRLYFYCSPNATPWAATYMLGRKYSPDDWVCSRIRRSCFGHNFKLHEWNEEYQMENYTILRGINNMVSPYKWAYQDFAKKQGYDVEDKRDRS